MTLTQNKPVSLKEIKNFWDLNPLFFGEFDGDLGSREYFEQHEKTVIEDCMAGALDNRFFSFIHSGRSILDIGCGPGFWVRQFCRMGLNVFACDLSRTAVELTKKSLELYGLTAQLTEGNAESLAYRDESFDYLNCQGVIHHTPDTTGCLGEFFRVLKPGGVVCFSVYHRNFFLRSPAVLRVLSVALSGRVGLKGRGRENILRKPDPDEIVRLFDGDENPLGKSYTVGEMLNMIRFNNLIPIKTWHHYFPARAFHLRISKRLHKILNDCFGLLIVYIAKKPEH
jgi:2-polyprenyl-3-methyl-5-hydroxy-6-metoxy-1,4-benzoquinol methylase